MSKLNYLAASGAAFVLATAVSTVAFAWHPQGKITKEVQNVTLNSAYADANDGTTAITARPGDVLRYRMTVVNPAPVASNQWNDLTKINVTDTLPAGVTLDTGAKDKNFGSVVVVPQSTPGNGTKSVSYVFTVKVNAGVADQSLICNTAKYTGNSITGDAPRSGEDKACVKVTVPTPPKQIQVCDLASKQIITINESQFDSSKHSKNLDDCCKEEPKTIQVCDLATKRVITIDETKFDSARHSKNLDDCKPPKMIDVCDLATKKVISIDEKNFDANKHSKDLNKCKEAPKTIQVCELATKKVITIEENAFDASKHSKNLDDCGQILSTTTETPVASLPTTLPSTGTNTNVFIVMTAAASSLAYGAVLFLRRNR